MNKLIKSMCLNRHYTSEWLRDINSCPHKLPSHIPEMCQELKKYHDDGEQIILFTDVDMDGIMAGVIGYAGMKELGFTVGLYTPDTGAYGVTSSEIDDLLSTFPQAKCILTGDIGIDQADGIAYARQRGLHVLITDRKKPQSDVLPEADVCVNPMCDEGLEYFGEVCGSYVMYCLLRYYAELFGEVGDNAVEQIERLKVFAGIGTISDSVPLWYENRVIAADAVSICQEIYHDGNTRVVDNIPGCQTYRNAFQGLFIILQKFAAQKKFSGSDSINEELFEYYITPAFNSIRRMHQKIQLAYTVFFRGPNAARDAMDTILKINEERKRIHDLKRTEILDGNTKQPWAPYIYLTDAIKGIQGLLAQDVMNRTNEPALVVSKIDDGMYSGFGRAPDWFPFLQETANLDYIHPTAHEQSFSVKLDNAESCQKLYDFLKQRVKELQPLEEPFVPDFTISTISTNADTNIDIELFEDFLYEIEDYRPFGHGFKKPVAELEFRLDDVEWQCFGKDKQHIKAVFPEGLELLCFNQAMYFPDGFDKSKMPEAIKACGELQPNVFNGKRKIQFNGNLEIDMPII